MELGTPLLKSGTTIGTVRPRTKPESGSYQISWTRKLETGPQKAARGSQTVNLDFWPTATAGLPDEPGGFLLAGTSDRGFIMIKKLVYSEPAIYTEALVGGGTKKHLADAELTTNKSVVIQPLGTEGHVRWMIVDPVNTGHALVQFDATGALFRVNLESGARTPLASEASHPDLSPNWRDPASRISVSGDIHYLVALPEYEANNGPYLTLVDVAGDGTIDEIEALDLDQMESQGYYNDALWN